MKKATLFAYLRRAPFGGRLTQQQVDGCNLLIDTCHEYAVTDPREVAYVLATVFHETGGTMAPVRETFAKTHKEAMRRLKGVKYAERGYYGRGFIQITWKDNYQRMGELLGVDLVNNPDLALNAEIAAKICVIGMMRGLFTGMGLSNYFHKTADPINARKIVNGLDKAKLIARYYHEILDALEADKKDVKEIKEEDAKPDGAALTTDKTTVGGVAGMIGAGGTGLLVGVDNVYALAAVALLIVVGAIGAWLFFSGRLELKHKGGV